MKIQPLALILVLALLATNSAKARLGETLDQLQSRLGAPTRGKALEQALVNGKWYPFGESYSFSKEGWSIHCILVNGMCAKIEYIKNAPFTDDDLKTILTNEAQGSTWAQTQSATTLIDSLVAPMMHVREWTRADGATAQVIDKDITLVTPAYTKASEAAKAQGTAEGQKKMPDL